MRQGTGNLQSHVWIYRPDHDGVRGSERATLLPLRTLVVGTDTIDNGDIMTTVVHENSVTFPLIYEINILIIVMASIGLP